MFYIIHVLLGGLIGLHFHSLLLVVLLAFLSHFVLDMLPHWSLGFDKEYFKEYSEPNWNKKMVFLGAIDSLMAIFILFMLNAKFESGLIIIGALVAVFPDIMGIGYFTRLKKRKKYKKFLHFHSNIQREVGFLAGCLIQITILLFLIAVLF